MLRVKQGNLHLAHCRVVSWISFFSKMRIEREQFLELYLSARSMLHSSIQGNKNNHCVERMRVSRWRSRISGRARDERRRKIRCSQVGDIWYKLPFEEINFILFLLSQHNKLECLTLCRMRLNTVDACRAVADAEVQYLNSTDGPPHSPHPLEKEVAREDFVFGDQRVATVEISFQK
jgi:hypothetical protein